MLSRNEGLKVIELKPKDIAGLSVIAMLLTIIVLMISVWGVGLARSGGCSLGLMDCPKSCSSSIDLSPGSTHSFTDKPLHKFPGDEYYPVDEPSSAYLFGIGGIILVARKLTGKKNG